MCTCWVSFLTLRHITRTRGVLLCRNTTTYAFTVILMSCLLYLPLLSGAHCQNKLHKYEYSIHQFHINKFTIYEYIHLNCLLRKHWNLYTFSSPWIRKPKQKVTDKWANIFYTIIFVSKSLICWHRIEHLHKGDYKLFYSVSSSRRTQF